MPSYISNGHQVSLESSLEFAAFRQESHAEITVFGSVLRESDGVTCVLHLRHTQIIVLRSGRRGRTDFLPPSRRTDVFAASDGSLLIPEGSVYADLRGYDKSTIERILSTLGASIVRPSSRMQPQHRLRSMHDPFTLATRLTQQFGVLAEPDFAILIPQSTAHIVCLDHPGDVAPWAFERIDVRGALGIHRGAKPITTALIDVGVEMRHRELEHALVPGVDTIDGDDWPDPPDVGPTARAHGTACAGLIAAAGHNDHGIIGIAPGTRIAPYRWLSWHPDLHTFISGTLQGLARCIREAVRRGARIMCIPYCIDRDHESVCSAIAEAIVEAVHLHQCVVVAAAGNDGKRVGFPACHEDVIAVAASNEREELCDDGDWKNGTSNDGPEVCLVAPGTRLWTTDISGGDGYNEGYGPQNVPSEYTTKFGGTSASAAIVAGVIALMLSVNPDLRPPDVRRILEDSADRVGTSARRRVNTKRAVEMAKQWVSS